MKQRYLYIAMVVVAGTTLLASPTAAQQVQLWDEALNQPVSDSYDEIIGGTGSSDSGVDSRNDALEIHWNWYTYPDGEFKGRNVTKSFENGTGDETKITTSWLNNSNEYILEALVKNQDDSGGDETAFFSRRYYIDNTSKNHNYWMFPNESGTTNSPPELLNYVGIDVNFAITDRTGQFPTSETAVIIEKAIELNNKNKSRQVHGEHFGRHEIIKTRLHQGRLHNIRVINPDGDERNLGRYLPQKDETIEFKIGQLRLDRGNLSTYAWNATMFNDSGQWRIKFRYNDTRDNTTNLGFRIYEHNNASNILVDETRSGPFGEFTWDQPLTDNESLNDWVVRMNATRNGSTVDIQTVVGRNPTRLIPGTPTWLKHVASYGLIIIVLGLFSKRNNTVGGFVTASVGGMLWWVGWMPSQVTGGMVFLAFAVAALYYMRSRRPNI